MEKQVYIISFGNSTKYRFTPSEQEQSLVEVSHDIKSYLAKKFPQLSSMSFFNRMTVTPVDATNKDEYKDYKEFNADSLSEIKKVLSVEIDDLESLSRLNSNAPWGIGAEK